MQDQGKAGSSATAQAEDQALIQSYLEGEDEAFVLLVVRHDGKLRALIRSLIGDGPPVEDVRQEVYLQVLRSLPTFRGESAFSTWLYRLAVHVCLDQRGREQRRRHAASLDVSDGYGEAALNLPADNPTEEPESAAARRWLARRVEDWLLEIPAIYRAPIVLADALEVPGPEVAAVLGLSLPALKGRLRRGRQMLRDLVRLYCAEAGIANWHELVE